MELSVEKAALLLLIAAVVAILTRRLRLPYSVGLVGAGIVLALLPFVPAVNLTKSLLFTVLLPPLIFEAAFSLQWQQLRKDFGVVLVLATLGVVLAAAVTTLGMHLLVHWRPTPSQSSQLSREPVFAAACACWWKAKACSMMRPRLFSLPSVWQPPPAMFRLRWR